MMVEKEGGLIWGSLVGGCRAWTSRCHSVILAGHIVRAAFYLNRGVVLTLL